MLPGANTTAGKAAYGLGAVVVTALCGWQFARTMGSASPDAVSHMVVCDACGDAEQEREIRIGADGVPELPLVCGKCGKRAVYLAHWCPSCGKLIPVDPAKPPTVCKHCGASLGGMFDRPAR